MDKRIDNNPTCSNTPPPLIYLDWNIIISFADGKSPDLLSILCKERDKRKILLVFSDAHIYEADDIANGEPARIRLADDRIRFLSELTANSYLFHPAGEDHSRIKLQTPEEVRARINEIDFAKTAMHTFVNMFRFDMMRDIRLMLGFDPSVLNNIKPPNVIDQLDRILAQKTSALYPELGPAFGLRTLLEKAEGYFPNSKSFGIQHHMAALFMALNFIGFWPDREGKTSPMASFYDSMHSTAATSCSYFVTEDRALRVKSMAAYEYLGIQTEILNAQEMLSAATSWSAK